MWYFADFNILIRKIILNKFQFQPQSVLNLSLFFWAISDSVFLLSLFLLKKSVFCFPKYCSRNNNGVVYKNNNSRLTIKFTIFEEKLKIKINLYYRETKTRKENFKNRLCSCVKCPLSVFSQVRHFRYVKISCAYRAEWTDLEC